MKKSNIEKDLVTAFENVTPNIVDSILSDCKIKKGKEMKKEVKNKKRNWFIKLSPVFATFIILVIGGMIFSREKENSLVSSIISLDVNPSIEIKVNKDDKVLEVNALNEDAKTVLGTMDFKNSNLEVVINALIGSMVRNGFISEISNSILVSVEGENQTHNKELQERLTAEINTMLKSDNYNGAVLSQTIEKTTSLKELAEKYDITVGKANLINEIVEKNNAYKFEDLATLSINELKLLMESKKYETSTITSTGKASNKSYIGEEKAKQIAMNHAKVTKITDVEIEFDYEDGLLVYEVGFTSGRIEYDYDINARTGEIVTKETETEEIEIDDEDDKKESTTQSPTQKQNSKNVITKASAKAIAVKHAKVIEGEIKNYEIELEKENGVQYYEIDFEWKNYEFSYEINAYTGSIIKYDKEIDD